MSKASRQTIVLLVVINGTLSTLKQYKLLPEYDFIIDHSMGTCAHTVNTLLAQTSDVEKSKKQMRVSVAQVNKVLGAQKQTYSSIVLVSTAMFIIEDLRQRIRDKQTLIILSALHDCITNLVAQIDPVQDCFDAYIKADDVLDTVYKCVGFNWLHLS